MEEVRKIIKKHIFLHILVGNGRIGVKAYFGHNPLISSIEYICENHFLGLKSHSEPFKHVKFNEFWYPKHHLRPWRKLEKSSKNTFFLLILGGNGKIGLKAYFGHNPMISSMEYGCENHFLGFKSHREPFKYVKFNEFWYPKQYLRPWRKLEKSSKNTFF